MAVGNGSSVVGNSFCSGTSVHETFDCILPYSVAVKYKFCFLV